MTQHNTDIAIIGGGASGLAAAIAAARHGAAVVILEKLPRVGKKLLATGNGRCNLGNLSRDSAHYAGSVNAEPILTKFQGEEAFFRSLGLVALPDEAGRLYPASGQAASVLDALRLECARLGVVEVCDFQVTEAAPRRGEQCSPVFHLRSKTGDTITAKRVILAAGGAAGPQYGTDGAGFKLAKSLGHQVTARYPALGPISVDSQRIRALKGLRVQARVTALKDGQSIHAEEGQVQFAEGALSGICVFNLSARRPDELALDLLPWCDDAAGLLSEITKVRADVPPEDMLTGLFPKRIGQVLLKEAAEKPLAELVKDWRFPALSNINWEAAQVTAGGVSGILPTLESPGVPGFYFAGEILDVHGDTGGFNLRWAWASGYFVGTEAARRLKR